MKKLSALLMLLFVAVSYSSFGDTIVKKRINATNRLIPLKKITVGPDDQYHGAVDPSGSTLVFTRKTNLVPHLCSQNLASGEVADFLPLAADSQEAAISPSGLVAFTYYKFNARGDICYRPAAGAGGENGMVCLKIDEGERSSPFWKSANELGYVLRNMSTLNSQIISQNIQTGAKQVLAQGKVFSPAMRPDGRYLVYNELSGGSAAGTDVQSRVMVVKDLQTGKVKPIRLNLPGISGFPAVSDDDSFVFFSHYLNDTNNDNIIDGSDNSVIFRIPIASLLKNDVSFPEQLTSAESNCSFPRPFKDQVLVTCAFEGGLDVYSVPGSGIVPSGWDQARLGNAHQTARTYEERILILNTLKYRFRDRDNLETQERILSDHLLANDTSAAKYYILGVEDVAPKDKKDFFALIRLYLSALEKKKAQPSAEEITAPFQKDILTLDGQIDKVSGHVRFKKILRGLLRTFLNQPQAAAGFLKQVKFDTHAEMLERYYFFDLANWTLPRTKATEGLIDVYRQTMTAPELSQESQIFYAFHFLQYLQTTKPSRKDRLVFLEKFNKGMAGEVGTLLQAESATLKIIEAPDAKTKQLAYNVLDGFMSTSRTDYFLRKALYVRAILSFADAAEFKYLGFVATTWLKYTTNEDTEFINARDVYIDATLDRAYDSYAKKSYQLSAGYFYGSLSLTDDLESHYGYIRSMVYQNQRGKLDEIYQGLVQRQFIDDNMKFVRALLILIDSHPKERGDTGFLDAALEQLKTMDQDRDSPVRYLMLGYLYSEKLQRTANGYDFDRTLFDEGDRSLLLAYDLGRDNDRVKASALLNLGMLHQRVQNHGLAVKYLAKRKDFGFTSPDEAARFAWLYSRSLFYTHQPDKAVLEIDQVLKSPTAKTLAMTVQNPLLERRAFYAVSAGQYSEAIRAYEQLFSRNAIFGNASLAKARLSYGFALLKLKREAEAQKALQASLALSTNLPAIPKGQDRLVDFKPVRLQLDAYGLLAHLGTDAERLDALEKRGVLLGQTKGLYDDTPALILQNRLQAARILTKTQPAKAALKMAEAIHLTEQWGDAGQYLSHAVFQSTVDYLAHGILHPELYSAANQQVVKAVLDKSYQAYAAQKQVQPFLDYQKRKLQILWAGFSAKVMKTKFDNAQLKQLASTSPVQSEELVRLVSGIGR